ncbi:MAG TPA: hypothetical protein VM695_04870 [Phycisphaerae bacterium]|nr:hypothetical protein [Phycisphaerae bacterium]
MGITATAQVLLRWPQTADVPAGGYYEVFGDGGDGSVDYDSPINPTPIDAWPDRACMDGYGYGGGGYGRGRYGAAEAQLTHVTESVADGRQQFAVVPYDAADNPAAGNLEAAVMVRGVPDPPTRLSAAAYAAGVLSLNFKLSADDDAA